MAAVEHFELAADNLDRAQKFYSELFGWEFEHQNFGDFEYTFIKTKGQDGQPGMGGGMMKRQMPEHSVLNYIGVQSIEDTLNQLQELGGKIMMPKKHLKGAGYMAICRDTEDNIFGLWESETK